MKFQLLGGFTLIIKGLNRIKIFIYYYIPSNLGYRAIIFLTQPTII
jgi:hypothetical protein